MKSPTASDLLETWEIGLEQSALKGLLVLLTKTFDLPDADAAAQQSIGERDAELLQLREELFGTKLVNKAHCPKCAETLEWEMNTREMQIQTPPFESPPRVYDLEAPPFRLRFRLPNSKDILTPAAYARHILLDCILEVTDDGKDFPKKDLPASVLDSLSKDMEKKDPQAHITMVLTCAACAEIFTVVFDIVNYLWAEIDNWAKHMLQEIFVLARAFGWSERDIISMSAHRRKLYLDMLQK